MKACAVRRALCAGLLGLAVACSKPDPDNYQSVADRIMVVIPRGATYYQALDSLESHGVIQSRDWFSLYARLRGGIKPTPAGVDGYMYPTTYVVPMRMRARDLMKVMTHEFIARWQPEWDARLGELHMTRHEIVTLASIIEAEVRYRPDRPYVSAVYHNRLKRGMALQADPTIVYAHGRRLRRVWERQLQIRSPYNTYLYPGLPPGPITQPSDSSIIAALYPAPIGYLYFVAQPDGKHIFSASYADHLAAIKRVRERRVTPAPPPPAGRRSAPRQ